MLYQPFYQLTVYCLAQCSSLCYAPRSRETHILKSYIKLEVRGC